jgi:hypothetical protein
MKQYLAELGIGLQLIIAGFAGGVLNALIMGNSRPFAVVTSIVAGTLTANYLAGTLAAFMNVSENAAAFLCGLTAMVLCQGILAAAKHWQLFHGKEVK